MTAAVQLTEKEREGGRVVAGERGREGGQLKRKSGVFSIFDMQATVCSEQQLRKRELLL